MPNELKKLAVDAARLASPVFKLNGWTYGGIGVPDEAELAATVLQLLEHAGTPASSGRVGSGRFWIHRYVDEGEQEHAHVTLDLGHIWKDFA